MFVTQLVGPIQHFVPGWVVGVRDFIVGTNFAPTPLFAGALETNPQIYDQLKKTSFRNKTPNTGTNHFDDFFSLTRAN